MPVVPFAQPQAAPDSGEFRLPGPTPDDTWSLMAAAQMHTEGRLVQPPEQEATVQQVGFFSKLFGSDKPAEKPVEKPKPAWPNQDELASARKNDMSYGDPSAEYFNYGKAKLPQFKSSDQMISAFRRDALGDIPRERVSPEVADQLFEGWVAAKKSPIAALGFDPDKLVTAGKSATGDDKFTLGGTYSPKKDMMFTTGQNNSTYVHESIHRGIEILRKAGKLPEGFDKHDEEIFTRALMLKHFGDVEKGRGDAGDKQVQQGEALLKNPKMIKFIDELEATAAQHLANKRPGGPR